VMASPLLLKDPGEDEERPRNKIGKLRKSLSGALDVVVDAFMPEDGDSGCSGPAPDVAVLDEVFGADAHAPEGAQFHELTFSLALPSSNAEVAPRKRRGSMDKLKPSELFKVGAERLASIGLRFGHPLSFFARDPDLSPPEEVAFASQVGGFPVMEAVEAQYAWNAGVRRHDVLTHVDARDVRSLNPEELVALFAFVADTAIIGVVREGPSDELAALEFRRESQASRVGDEADEAILAGTSLHVAEVCLRRGYNKCFGFEFKPPLCEFLARDAQAKIPPEFIFAVDSGTLGVPIVGVEEGGAAALGGLRQGDVVTHVDGAPIHTWRLAKWRRTLRCLPSGQNLWARVVRTTEQQSPE